MYYPISRALTSYQSTPSQTRSVESSTSEGRVFENVNNFFVAEFCYCTFSMHVEMYHLIRWRLTSLEGTSCHTRSVESSTVKGAASKRSEGRGFEMANNGASSIDWETGQAVSNRLSWSAIDKYTRVVQTAWSRT
jgi:hypothetical protein